jgi:hypothetical protein
MAHSLAFRFFLAIFWVFFIERVRVCVALFSRAFLEGFGCPLFHHRITLKQTPGRYQFEFRRPFPRIVS